MRRRMFPVTVLLAALGIALGAGAGTAEAFFGTYTVTDPNVFCTSHVDAAGRVVRRTIVPNTPGMFAPDEPAQVSWQPVLHRWNGHSWAVDVVGHMLVGFAGMSHALPDSTGFTINLQAGHYYAVSIVYRWYSNGQVVKTMHRWASTHVTQATRSDVITYGQFLATGRYCRI